MKFNFRSKDGSIISSFDKPISQLQPKDTAKLQAKFGDKTYQLSFKLMRDNFSSSPAWPQFCQSYSKQGQNVPASPAIVFQRDNKAYVCKYTKGLSGGTGSKITITLADKTDITVDCSSGPYNYQVISSDNSLYYDNGSGWAAVAGHNFYEAKISLYRKSAGAGGDVYTLIAFVNIQNDGNNHGYLYYIDFTAPEQASDWQTQIITGDLHALDNGDTKLLHVYNDGLPHAVPGTARRIVNNERASGQQSSGAASLEAVESDAFSGSAGERFFFAPYSSYTAAAPNSNYPAMRFYSALQSYGASNQTLSKDRITPLERYSWNALNGNPAQLQYTVPAGSAQEKWVYQGKGRITETVSGKTYNCVPMDCIPLDYRTYQTFTANGSNYYFNWKDILGNAQMNSLLPFLKMVSTVDNFTITAANAYKYQYLVLLPTRDYSNLFGEGKSQYFGPWGIQFSSQPDLSGWQLNDGMYAVMYIQYLFANTNFDSDISGWDVSRIGALTSSGARGVFENCPIREAYKPKAWQTAENGGGIEPPFKPVDPA